MRKAFTQIQHYYILAIVCMVGLIIWLPDSGYDKYFWVTWAQYIQQHGLAQAYNNPDINYHPVVLFIIKGFTLVFKNPNYTSINWLKVPTALFDWGIIFIALKLLKQHRQNLQWGLLLALNPAFWYNTVIWGQFDSIWVFFTLLAFYMANRKFLFYSIIAFVFAINTKLFALFFLPFLIIFWLRLKPDSPILHYTKPLKFWPVWKPIIAWLSLIIQSIALQIVFLLPFLLTTRYPLSAIVQRSTEYYNSLSRNAYNIWYWLFDDPVGTNDDSFLILSILFVGAVFCWLIYLQYKGKTSIWAIAALASLTFFFFLTRMHERYAHAALVFSCIAFFGSSFKKGVDGAARQTGDFFSSPFGNGAGVLLISLAYLFNLEAVMQMLHNSLGLNIDYTAIWFNPKLIATLYFIACLLNLYNVIKSPKQPISSREGQG